MLTKQLSRPSNYPDYRETVKDNNDNRTTTGSKLQCTAQARPVHLSLCCRWRRQTK